MRIMEFSIMFAIAMSFQPSNAAAQGLRAVKFESRYEKKVKGAVCTVIAGGQAIEFKTPSRVKLPLDENGELNVTRLSCDLQGLKRSTGYFPSSNKFGADIYGVAVDFKSEKAEFWFKKKNGGVALYTRGSDVINVR